MSQDDTPQRSKPKLAAVAASPLKKKKAQILPLPAPGSIERAWRIAAIKTAKSPSASWALGCALLASVGVLFYGSFLLSQELAIQSAPILDRFSSARLGSSLGLQSLLSKHPLGASVLLGYALLLCMALCLRWAAWAAIDFPMAIGSKAASSNPNNPVHKMPLPLSSYESFALHLAAIGGIWICALWAGSFNLDAMDQKIKAYVHAPATNSSAQTQVQKSNSNP